MVVLKVLLGVLKVVLGVLKLVLGVELIGVVVGVVRDVVDVVVGVVIEVVELVVVDVVVDVLVVLLEVVLAEVGHGLTAPSVQVVETQSHRFFRSSQYIGPAAHGRLSKNLPPPQDAYTWHPLHD